MATNDLIRPATTAAHAPNGGAVETTGHRETVTAPVHHTHSLGDAHVAVPAPVHAHPRIS